MTTTMIPAVTTMTTKEYRGYTGTFWYEPEERGFDYHGIVDGHGDQDSHHFYATCMEDIQSEFEVSVDFSFFLDEVMPDEDPFMRELYLYLAN